MWRISVVGYEAYCVISVRCGIRRISLTPTCVVNECSSTMILGSILTENDPELHDKLVTESAQNTKLAYLKSLFKAPTNKTKSAASTSSLTTSTLFAPA